MKKIFFLFLLGVSLISCEVNDYNDGYELVLLPVAEVEMQDAFAKDSLTNIPVKYLRPSNCHFFEDFYYQKNDFTRTVAIYCSRLNKDNCQSIQNDTIEVPLKFRPTELGTYQFKFWRGVDAQGQDMYYEHQVEVNH